MPSQWNEIADQSRARVVWNQFSIRDFLVAMTIAALILQAIKRHRKTVHSEQESAALLTEAGGRIVFDTDQDWKNPRPKCFPSQRIQEIAGKQHFQYVVSADLCGVDLTQERLQLVIRLKRLYSLDLVGRETTDDIASAFESATRVDTHRYTGDAERRRASKIRNAAARCIVVRLSGHCYDGTRQAVKPCCEQKRWR